MASKFLSFLVPKKIEEVNSKINGPIQVVEFLGQPRLLVDNLIQSGGMLTIIWRKGLKKVLSIKDRVSRILILGLGGGTLVGLINQYFPQAEIDAVEIDPVMIELGKKYFQLGNFANLKIYCQDAVQYVQQAKNKTYDLILVDLYLGKKVPPFTTSPAFLDKLKKMLTNQGIIIFNRLFYDEHRKLSQIFVKQLEKYFSSVKLIRAWSNLLVVVYN